MLDPRASSEKKGAQLATVELMAVKAEIDKAIEKAAPGFKQYLKTYSEMSKPVDEMKYLQKLNLLDTKKENFVLSKVQAAIDKIEAQQSARGANPAKSISKETVKALKNLRDDLRRSQNIDLGKARGSDTAQNLATGSLADEGGVPVLGAAVGALTGHPLFTAVANKVARKAVGERGDKAAMQLASRLLNPEAPLKNVTPKASTPGRVAGVARLLGRALIPASGAIAAQ